MPLTELEQTIIAKWRDDSSRNKTDIRKHLFRRKHLINNDHPIAERELSELKRVNKLLTKHTFRVCAEAEELFEKLKTEVLSSYNEVTVSAILFPSGDLIKYDGDENTSFEAMSEILGEELLTIPSEYLLEISLNYNRATGEECSDYMCFYDEDTRMWDNLFNFTFKSGEIDEKDAFELYHPMHALYDHSPYSLQDIIRISDFKSEIRVTFE